jgi:hypothetical protein
MNKLDHKKMGPFKLTKVVGRLAYQLELPPQISIHPVFHVSLLEKFKSPADPKGRVEPPQVEEIKGEMNWVVRKVADSRVNRERKIVQKLVLCEGCEKEAGTWEPSEHLRNSAKKCLLSFHIRHPMKPRDIGVIGRV